MINKTFSRQLKVRSCKNNKLRCLHVCCARAGHLRHRQQEESNTDGHFVPSYTYINKKAFYDFMNLMEATIKKI